MTRSRRMNHYRLKKCFLILLSLFWIVGCSPTLPTPIPSTVALPTETATPLSQSTTAPAPTAISATPTLTPEPTLRTNGPYFAYFRQVDGVYQLVMMDADGGGRKVIELPQNIVDSLPNKQNDLDVRFLSPDGKWLAFYTGFAGNFGFGNDIGNGPFDLTLNLLDLTTGQVSLITPLLSKDYPNNFDVAAKKLSDPNKTAKSLYDAFINGITRTLAWSPDGKYLAFGGEMDGLSSDLYLYKAETKTIQRLSSGDEELQWIDWSPDGKWVMHGSTFWVGEGMTYDIYAAAVDGSSVNYVSTSSFLGNGINVWLNSHVYFENDAENGLGRYGLRLVNIDNGNITKIWDGSFDSYAVDKSNTWVMLSGASALYAIDPNFVPNFYLVNLKTLAKSKFEVPDPIHTYSNVSSFGLSGQDFVITDSTAEHSMFLSVDGKFIQTDLGDEQISVSPNSKYWLAVENQAIKIFSADNTLIKTSDPLLPKGYVDFLWRPDSSGLFIISGTRLYSVNIPTDDINALESTIIDNYGLTYKWINGQ